MKTQVIIVPTAGQHYAASKTNTAANSASSPELLAAGAFGIYTDNTSGGYTLVERTNSSRLGKIYFFVGMPNGRSPRAIAGVPSSSIRRLYTSRASAAVKSFSILGFNGTTGTGLNLPTVAATQTKYYDLGLTLVDNKVPYDRANLACTITSTDTPYSVCAKLYEANARRKTAYKGGNRIVDVSLGIVTNGTRTAMAAGATVSIANGSLTLTLGAAISGITTGSFLRLAGQTYQIVGTASSDTVLTLDRPFHGTTQSAVNVNANTAYGTMASITEAGLLVYSDTTAGLIELSMIDEYNSTITNNANKGAITIAGLTYSRAAEAVGSYDQVAEIEKNHVHNQGYNTPIETWWPEYLTTTVADTTFDLISVAGEQTMDITSPANQLDDYNHQFYFATTGSDSNNTGVEACLTILSTLAAFNGVVAENKNGNILS
jgi:hypothetical protein